MHPFLMFLLAIITPFLLAGALLVPTYGGILAAAYLLYLPETGLHPLANHLVDVFYILNVYDTLFSYWSQNSSAVSFTQYTLPLLALPVLGVALSLYGTYRLVRFLLNIFHLSARVY